MNNRDKLIEKAIEQSIRAFFAGTEETHLSGMNNRERFWAEWCSLEDIEIIGDLSIHKPEARTPITISFEEYGLEECINCGKNAHAYYDEMLLKCPHCKREYEVEMDEDGWLSYTFLGEYNGEYNHEEEIRPTITVYGTDHFINTIKDTMITCLVCLLKKMKLKMEPSKWTVPQRTESTISINWRGYLCPTRPPRAVWTCHYWQLSYHFERGIV